MASRISWEKEAVLCAALLLVGVVGLPLAIYAVGQRVIGEYAQDQGLFDLVATVWAELASPSLAAWILVLSPYLGVLLMRVAWALWRSRRARVEGIGEESGGTASNW